MAEGSSQGRAGTPRPTHRSQAQRRLQFVVLVAVVALVQLVLNWSWRTTTAAPRTAAAYGRGEGLKRTVLSTDAADAGDGVRCGAEAHAAYRKAPHSVLLAKLCEPHPWLLPPRVEGVFPYSSTAKEEELLALRAVPFGGHARTLSVFVFTRAMALLAQNYVYTLVRFAGVTNYVAATGNAQDYAACLDLNLPCWDASRFIPIVLEEGEGDALHGTRTYNAITWWKPRIVAHLVAQGFVTHMSDVDIAYSTKPLWASYLRYIEDAKADAAMAFERGKVRAHGSAPQIDMEVMPNTGNYVVLPTRGGRAFTRRWAAAATRFPKLNDQTGLHKVRRDSGGESHILCWLPQQCARARAEIDAAGNSTGLVRLYSISYTTSYPTICLLAVDLDANGVALDVCHWTMMYIHAICRSGGQDKIAGVKAAGFWLIDEAGQAGGELPRPPPLRWQQPHVEDRFWQCQDSNIYPLAFTFLPDAEERAAVAAQLAGGMAAVA